MDSIVDWLVIGYFSVVDPDPHHDGENGSGTDPGSIKSSQNKGDFFVPDIFGHLNPLLECQKAGKIKPFSLLIIFPHLYSIWK